MKLIICSNTILSKETKNNSYNYKLIKYSKEQFWIPIMKNLNFEEIIIYVQQQTLNNSVNKEKFQINEKYEYKSKKPLNEDNNENDEEIESQKIKNFLSIQINQIYKDCQNNNQLKITITDNIDIIDNNIFDKSTILLIDLDFFMDLVNKSKFIKHTCINLNDITYFLITGLDDDFLELFGIIDKNYCESNNFLNDKNKCQKYKEIIKCKYVFETLSQTTLLINHLLLQYNRYISNSQKILNDKHNTPSINTIEFEIFDIKNEISKYFSNALIGLYLLETEIKDKNFRKREIVVSSKDIFYYPFIHFFSQVINEFFKTNCNKEQVNLSSIIFEYIKNYKIDFFIQRSPIFYFAYKENSLAIQSGFKMYFDDFRNLNILYKRSKQIEFLKEFCLDFMNDYKSNFLSDKINDNKIRNDQNIIYNSNKDNEKQFNEKNNFNIDDDFEFNNNENYNNKIFLQIPNTYVADMSLDNNYFDSIFDINTDTFKFNDIIIKPEYSGNHKLFLLRNLNKIKKSNTELNSLINKNISLNSFDNNLFIIQEFVPHNNYIVKVYCINNHVKVCTRSSINKDIIENDILLETNQIYDGNYNIKADYYELSMINPYFFKILCKSLSKKLNMTLFNLDLIINKKDDIIEIYIIEINYFPSYKEYEDKLLHIFNKQLRDKFNKENSVS